MADTAALVERCRRGDELAWEALVRRYQGRVYAVACHYLRDPEEARDAAQEVFLRVWRHLDRFTGSAFLPWVLRLARNCCIDRLRRIKARPPASDVPVESEAPIPDPSPGPEAEAASSARQRLVHRALDAMSEQNREILLLKEIQGLNFREIAEMLDLPIGTVKSRSNRARVELARRVLALDPSYGVPRRTGGPPNAFST